MCIYVYIYIFLAESFQHCQKRCGPSALGLVSCTKLSHVLLASVCTSSRSAKSRKESSSLSPPASRPGCLPFAKALGGRESADTFRVSPYCVWGIYFKTAFVSFSLRSTSKWRHCLNNRLKSPSILWHLSNFKQLLLKHEVYEIRCNDRAWYTKGCVVFEHLFQYQRKKDFISCLIPNSVRFFMLTNSLTYMLYRIAEVSKNVI